MFSWVDPYVFFSTAFSTHSTLLYSLYSTLRFKVCVSSGAWAPPGMDVELPPDVASGGESGVDVESDVDLPPSVGDDDEPPLSTPCACALKCWAKFDMAEIEGQREQFRLTSSEDRRAAMFQAVRGHVCNADGTMNEGRINWQYQGHRVCRAFWEHAHGTGHKQVDKIKGLIVNGHNAPLAPSKRRMPRACSQQQYHKADHWFFSLYQSLGEPLANEDKDLDHEHVSIGEQDHPLWDLGTAVGSENDAKFVPKRYLNPGTFQDIWILFQSTVPASEQVSRSTLYTCWSQRWKNYLQFRNIGQGKRCKICAALDERRLQATSEEEKARVEEEKNDHINDVMAARNYSVRGNKQAVEHARNPSQDGLDKLLKITIDGMDQAKFRVPRNLCSSAEFESLWRPQLHVVGTIVHGHLECYFIMDTDMAKDSNMNCSVVSRVLDIIHFERFEDTGNSMPRNLSVAADNTCRESKNQHFANYMSYLINQDKFEIADVEYMKTGHTHNEQDQRFSTVASILNRAPVLEDPEEFAEWIRAHVKPVAGRMLHVEVLQSTLDFQRWFLSVGVQISGLAATHLEPDTCHHWRFAQRHKLSDEGPAIEIHHDGWKGLEKHRADTILLVKEALHSREFAQAPVLVQPHVVGSMLDTQALRPAPRLLLGDRALKEYRKTAAAMGREPWKLFKAQHYLESLCYKNENQEEQSPLSLWFALHSAMKPIASSHDACFRLPGEPSVKIVPRRIVIGAMAKRTLKRPAAVMKKPAGEGSDAAGPDAAGPGPDAAAAGGGGHDPGAAGPGPGAGGDAGGGGGAAAAAAPLMKRPAAKRTQVTPGDRSKGCGKCRYSALGCTVCRAWAHAGVRGYSRGTNGTVLNGTPPP